MKSLVKGALIGRCMVASDSVASLVAVALAFEDRARAGSGRFVTRCRQRRVTEIASVFMVSEPAGGVAHHR
jgi:hypothetical protein